MNKLQDTQLMLYQIASRVHWPARERAFRDACCALQLRTGRIIDIGCGPGLLAKPAISMGFSYLGIDPDKAAIVRARDVSRFEHASFAVADAAEASNFVKANDIAVLNGVCHHLSEAVFSDVLRSLRMCRGIFVLDHQLDSLTSPLNRLLQKHDKGKYVRQSELFAALPGYQRVYHEVFPIPAHIAPVWRYFCSYYVPENAPL